MESCLHDSFLRRAVRVMYCWVIRACTSRASAGSPVQKRRSAKVCTGEDRHGHCASGPLYFTRLDKSDSHNWKCQHCWYIARFLPRRFSPLHMDFSPCRSNPLSYDVKRFVPKLSRFSRAFVFPFINQWRFWKFCSPQIIPWLDSKGSTLQYQMSN